MQILTMIVIKITVFSPFTGFFLKNKKIEEGKTCFSLFVLVVLTTFFLSFTGERYNKYLLFLYPFLAIFFSLWLRNFFSKSMLEKIAIFLFVINLTAFLSIQIYRMGKTEYRMDILKKVVKEYKNKKLVFWKKENSEERSGPELQQVDQKLGQKQTPQSTGKPTRDAVNLLKSNIYPELGEKPVSEINKQDVTAILKNVYGSRKEVIQIIWNIYPNYPVVQLAVLFILLFVTIDFLPALVTTSLYFIITVCVTVGRDLWIENKQQY